MRRKIKQVMNKKGEEYMVKIKMMPLCGIEVNDSSIIEFGQSRKDLINILGKGDAEIEDRIYYFENCLQLEFVDGRLAFAEVSKDENLVLSLYGVNPFQMQDAELISFLCKKCGGEDRDSQNCDNLYDFCIQSQSIAFHRGITPKDTAESIAEAKAEGCYNTEMENDYLQSKYFETAAIGMADYFKE